jgi:hypothetical protein
MIKRLLAGIVLAMGLYSTVHADQSADSFGTGFANALQRAMEARQNQQSTNYTPPLQGHFDIRDNNGNLHNYIFVTRSQCERYIENAGLEYSCEWIDEK